MTMLQSRVWVDVCPLEDLIPGRGVCALVAGLQVAVFRIVNNQRMVAVFDLNLIRTGRMDDPQVFANDVIFVDRSGAKTMWRDVISSVPIMSMFVPVL